MAEQKKYKHIFCDMDGTLTESRSLVSREIESMIKHALGHVDFAVISGATIDQIYKQIPFLMKEDDMHLFVMGQSGNHTVQAWKHRWKNALAKQHVNAVRAHIELIKRHLHINHDEDLVEERGAQVAFSLVGHHAGKNVKKAFDPKGDKRRELLRLFPFETVALMVRIGGTTCLDYTGNGWGKKGNIERLIKEQKWNTEDCVYIGDQLYKGGNDEDMLGFIDTIMVTNTAQTYKTINSLIHG